MRGRPLAKATAVSSKITANDVKLARLAWRKHALPKYRSLLDAKDQKP